MHTLSKLENWYIIRLTHDHVIGKLQNGYTIFTHKILGIKDKYLITDNTIYELGQVDKIWINTNEAKVLDEYEI